MISRFWETWKDCAWLWIVLSVPQKCMIVWFPGSGDRQKSGMWSRGWAVALKYSVRTRHENASSVLGYRWLCLIENHIWLRKIGLGLVLVGTWLWTVGQLSDNSWRVSMPVCCLIPCESCHLSAREKNKVLLAIKVVMTALTRHFFDCIHST